MGHLHAGGHSDRRTLSPSTTAYRQISVNKIHLIPLTLLICMLNLLKKLRELRRPIKLMSVYFLYYLYPAFWRREFYISQFQFQFSLFANKGAHTWAKQFEEYKHNKTYLQGTSNTSNYSFMCWGRYDTSTILISLIIIMCHSERQNMLGRPTGTSLVW